VKFSRFLSICVLLSASASMLIAAGCSNQPSDVASPSLTPENSPPIEQSSTTPSSIANFTNEELNQLRTPGIKKSYKLYLRLLGADVNQLPSLLNEEPLNIDEGGYEYKRADFRLWPNESGKVGGIWSQSKDIDFEGLNITDPLEKFKKVFGEPIYTNDDFVFFKLDKHIIEKSPYSVYFNLSE
jgi:hypothetical protein